ncbi:MAG: hypothetical protein ACI88G_002264, partial [Woeseiaceae bacterium]
QKLELTYRAQQTDQVLSIDTSSALSGLHLDNND